MDIQHVGIPTGVMCPASETSSSDDEDYAKFAAISVSAEQVVADHQKAAKQVSRLPMQAH